MGEISIDPKFNIHETYKKVRILNPYRNSAVPASLPLIFTINTNLGTGTSMEIPTYGSGYDYSVKWGDGVITSGHTTDASHTYAAHGVYTLEITGSFPQFYFFSAAYSNKLISIDNWGNINYSTSQNRAFNGTINLASLSNDISWINAVTDISVMFRTTGLTSLPELMTLDAATNGDFAFDQTPLNSLPSGMVLGNLTTANTMFVNTNISYLPSGMNLSSLTNGSSMFYTLSITSLPNVMLLDNLVNGYRMFSQTSLNYLPSGMTLPNLTTGTRMFRSTSISSLPIGMNLSNLISGDLMFYGVPLTDLPSGMTLPNLTNGNLMFFGSTINTVRYSQLLIDMESGNANTGVKFHGGNSKYNASGETARNALVARGWIFTDGGLAA